MDMAGWVATVILVALLALAIIATRRGWMRNESRPEDHVSLGTLEEISRNRASNGIGP